MNIILRPLIIVTSCLLLCSCMFQQQPVAPLEEISEEPVYFIHTIEHPGESLWIIANWYTGDGAQWKTLLEQNPELNPYGLQLGDKISIPEDLLTNSKPLPRRVVQAAQTQLARRIEPASGKEVSDSEVEVEAAPQAEVVQVEYIDPQVDDNTYQGDDIRAQLWAELELQ